MKKKKTLADLKPMTDQERAAGIENLNPYIHDAIKDRLDSIPVDIQECLIQKIPLSRKAMIEYGIPFNRHEMREIALQAIYQNLLTGRDIRKALYDAVEGSNEVDTFLYNLAVGTVENKEELTRLLSSRLREDWPWDRLSVIDQAILLMAAQELLVDENTKNIVINEAVTLAKEFSDDESPKMINGILDSIA